MPPSCRNRSSEQPPVTAGEWEGGVEASPPQQSLVRVLERIAEHEENGSNQNPNSTVSFRLVGRGGKTVERIRQESGGSVRVLAKYQVPPSSSSGDEFIQIRLSDKYEFLMPRIGNPQYSY
ncbi:hypothetical protein HN51_053203 [Arachis hypogaea]